MLRWPSQWMMKARALMRRDAVESELDEEIQDHLARETENLIALGYPADEAARRARATFGGVEHLKEECRDSRGVSVAEQLGQDLAYAARILLRNRTYALMSLLTIATGISATTAVFSVVDHVLFRALPFPEPQRLYSVQGIGIRGPVAVMRRNSALADYAAFLPTRGFNLTGKGEPARVKGTEVSANFLPVMGVAPRIGRGFGLPADTAGMAREVILSHGFWMEHHGGRETVIGETIVVDETPHQIVGVMPEGFRYPDHETRFWTPMGFDPRKVGEFWGSGGVNVVARLRPGATADAASAELRAFVPRILKLFPWRMPDAWARDASLVPLQGALVAGVKAKSLLLMGTVTLVLLIAVVNVASLMGVHYSARQREFDVRVSLGASPARLMRQLLAEALLLTSIGGAMGATLAYGLLPVLTRLLPADTPRLAEVAIDGRVLAFAMAVALGSGVFLSLVPALRARARQSVHAAEAGRASQRKSARRTAGLLVVAETAFATMLLVAAGLLLRSLVSLLQSDPGFRTESVVTAEVSATREDAGVAEKMTLLANRVRDRLTAVPGVERVAASDCTPVTPGFSSFAAAIEDHPRRAEEGAFSLRSQGLTAGYLETIGVRLVQGRVFTEADRKGSAPVVLVSASMARRYWPQQSAVGKRLRPVWQNEWRTIVGVVDDVNHYGFARKPAWIDGEVYWPIGQVIAAPQSLSVAVRVSGGEGASIERNLPSLIHEVCASCPVSKVARMETVVRESAETPRSTAWLVGGFALIALALGAAGMYGVVGQNVLRRTKEFAVKLALGARPGALMLDALASTLGRAAAGSAIGLAGSWTLTEWMRSLLFEIAPHDPVTFLCAPVVLIAVALAAGLAPAARTLRIDPVQALRDS